MNAISNFAEAKEALKALGALAHSIETFIISMEQRIDAVYALKGNPVQPDLPLREETRLLNLPENAPESWRDRVLTIYKAASVPLTQKEVVHVYEKAGWPKDFASSLYATISSSIAYLARTGKLTKTENGYRISTLTGMPQRKLGIPLRRPQMTETVQNSEKHNS